MSVVLVVAWRLLVVKSSHLSESIHTEMEVVVLGVADANEENEDMDDSYNTN